MEIGRGGKSWAWGGRGWDGIQGGGKSWLVDVV